MTVSDIASAVATRSPADTALRVLDARLWADRNPADPDWFRPALDECVTALGKAGIA